MYQHKYVLAIVCL